MFSTSSTLAAVVAFTALGANFIAGALLLLLNPGSRAVRWFALFTLAQVVWLLLQGLLLLYELPPIWSEVYGIDVHLLPALFFAATLVHVYGDRPRWLPFVPLLVAILVLLLIREPLESPLAIVWHAATWSTAGFLQARRRSKSHRTTGGRVLNLILTIVVPIGVVGAIMLEGGFVLYALPLMTIAIQLLIFTGVVHHSFYDIEVRAARTGELAANAAEHDRLALLGELAATIAHEVRNPLTGIRSLTQRIGDEPLDEDKRRRYTDVILGEITRLDRIVSNLTDLARRTTLNGGGRAEPTALAPLFEDLVLLVEARARRAGVTVIAHATDVVVNTSREALAQALLNLLLNAIAQTPAGTTVELHAVRADGSAAILVRDHGPGVPEEQRAAVFEPFQTGGGGTGLGLTVVRRLADEHNWTVGVGDAPEHGAEFRLTIASVASVAP